MAVGKTKVGPIPIRSPVFFLSGHGSTAMSKSARSPNSVRVPPLELGTVTNAKVGLTNCINGSRVYGGTRGISGLMMASGCLSVALELLINALISLAYNSSECVMVVEEEAADAW